MLVKGKTIKTMTHLDQFQHEDVVAYLLDQDQHSDVVGDRCTDHQIDKIVNYANGQWTVSLYKQ